MAAPSRLDLSVINVVAELERLEWSWQSVGDDEIRMSCPVPSHKDNTPSVNFNTAKNVWQCHAAGCKAKGDIVTFIGHVLQADRTIVLEELKQRYPLESVKSISPATVEKFHQNLKEAGPLLAELTKRGVTDEDIRKARIGFWKGRLTIPVYSASGHVINVRRYLPGAPGNKKMQNTPGYGSAAIYQIDQLGKFDTIWICGGELKALVAARMLNPLGAGAISISSGEGTWVAKWNPLLKDKSVFICMDVDAPGRHASETLARFLYRVAKEVYIVRLPLDTEKHPKGDINDYVGQEGATREDFARLMEEAEEFVPQREAQVRELAGDAEPVPLDEAVNPQRSQRRLGYNALIFGYFDTPYLVPRKVMVGCDKAQTNCAICPIFTQTSDDPSEGVVCEIPPWSSALLEMVDSPKKVQRTALMSAAGIPPCKTVRFDVRSQYALRDVRLTPQLAHNASEASGSNLRLPAYVVDARCEPNVPYAMQGVTYPDPKTQAAVLLIDRVQQIEDSLTSYQPTPGDITLISRVLRPAKWTVEAIEAKLDAVYQDLAYNVHGIYGRLDMQTVLDVTWYSPLFLTFEGRRINGWVNSLILGDSAQGKTEMSSRLIEHYGCGTRVECKNASAAGLIGGLQQMGNRWFVSWGVIPQNDRRMVLLEEVKGLQVHEIGRLTDMRSSGVAELPKIEHGRANARTRLAFISNPREQRGVSSYAFGIEAILQLIGSLEDVRRFDIAYIAAAQHVSAETINQTQRQRKPVEHTATHEICKKSVLLAWTRTEDDLRFDSDAEDRIHELSLHLCNLYTDAIPLIDRGSARQKLARITAGIAAKTASYEDGACLVIRKAHVEVAGRLIQRIYDDSVFGYRSFSELRQKATAISDREAVASFLRETRYPRDVVNGLLSTSVLSPEDIQTWFSVDREVALDALSLLVRRNCLTRHDRTHYRKTEAFIVLLRELYNENLPTISDNCEEEF